jgi:DNA helicase-2/ATP-dependent DNA helicase PcrA
VAGARGRNASERAARGGPYGGGQATGAGSRPAERTYAPEDEDQSQHSSGLRLGMRVRHPQFGIGTVLGIEDHADDLKVTVRFAAVGVKRLLAKFARLEGA